MADTVIIPKADYVALLDAIREKSGTSALMTTPEAAAVVDAIETGGGDPQEDLIKVNNNTLTSFSNSTITKIRAYMFKGCSALTSIDIPNVTKIDTEAFYGAKIAGNLTIEKYLSTFGNGAFRANSFATATFKNGVWRLDNSCFESCTNLTAVDIGDSGNVSLLNISGGAFYNTQAITALILRRSSAVFPLASAFPSTSGLYSTATIYVPNALLNDYKTATNWSTYADRIVAIEGSIYETQFADGTPISS